MTAKLKSFEIETFDGGAYLHFFTKAENHKKALRRLQTHSHDYKSLVNKNQDLIIKVKEIK